MRSNSCFLIFGGDDLVIRVAKRTVISKEVSGDGWQWKTFFLDRERRKRAGGKYEGLNVNI